MSCASIPSFIFFVGFPFFFGNLHTLMYQELLRITQMHLSAMFFAGAEFSNIPCRDLNSVIVTLDEYGHLYCSYLGTDPSLFVAPPVDSRDLNYAELDKEMKELQIVIKQSSSRKFLPICNRIGWCFANSSACKNFSVLKIIKNYTLLVLVAFIDF